MRWSILAIFGFLAACDVVVEPSSSPPPEDPAPAASRNTTPQLVSPARASASFAAVVARVEPIAERMCREQRRGRNCDFNILVDVRPGVERNAFQTIDKNGRPLVVFTRSLIADVRNPDELAFILGHETAHHIRGHIPQTQQSAVAGAVIAGVLASIAGASAETVETAQNIGGTVGARRYSKGFELEADALGTRIAAAAGYDPVRGAAYFQRIPDPGDRFLGTHPPNAERIRVVRQTAASL